MEGNSALCPCVLLVVAQSCALSLRRSQLALRWSCPRPPATDVPWEASSQSFQGKIVHHEETARLKALQLAVDSAVKEIEGSIDQAPDDGEETITYK